jgi:phosphoglycolate phosphatase-like HAD superfamily hydrolase
MFGPIHNFVFDFDGTLVDSMPVVVEGLTWAIAQCQCEVPSRNELVATFGPPPEGVLARWVPAERRVEALKLWHEFEAKAPLPRVFDGINELLELIVLKKRGLGLFTGRDRASTTHILTALGWTQIFEPQMIVCGDDAFSNKPSGAALKHMAALKNWAPKESLMVGDHPFDMAAARDAGFRAGAALWDLPHEAKTQKAKFRQSWSKWNDIDCDLRIADPQSLHRWLGA